MGVREGALRGTDLANCLRMSEVAAAARGILFEERSALLAWLNRGLREGRAGRLEVEYPVSLAHHRWEDHRAVFRGPTPVSHAMLHPVTQRARGRALAIGLIGLVYTEPACRGQGLAGRCVEACLAELQRRGIPLAALWSDRPSFYARLGFHPAGREVLLLFEPSTVAQARAGEPGLQADRPASGDWSVLESLYAARSIRAERPAGALRDLARAPETTLRVARRDGSPVAYAALGRGDDFGGVVHEWAGEAEGVLACLEELGRGRETLGFLAGPEEAEPGPALRAAGATAHPGSFALVRLLDAGAVWRALAPAAARGIQLVQESDGVCVRTARADTRLGDREALDFLFSGSVPGELGKSLSDEEAAELASALPLPLYLWGFDSI